MAWDDVLVAYVSKYTAAIHNEMVTQIKARILHSLDTEANGVLVGTGAGAFIFKTLAQFKTILGLGDAAYKNTGSSTGTLCAGDDSRLSNDRNPTAHKSTHATGGDDALSASDVGAATTSTKLDDFGTPDDNTDLDANTTNHGLLLKATAPAANVLNVVGIANGETSYANKALFDSTNPAMDGTAAPGTSLYASHRDHVHGSDTTLMPRLRAFFTPTYLYASNGAEKSLRCINGYHLQSSSADADYMICPVFCSGSETICDVSIYKNTDRGIFDLYVSNNDTTYNLDSSGYDIYNSSPSAILISVTLTRSLVAGWNYLKFVINSKNVSSSNYYFGIYGVRLR